jgi:hypothetical protein
MDRKVVGAVVAAVALAAGGCGSSSKPLTRTAFVSRANAVCNRARAAIERGRPTNGIEGFAVRLKRSLKIELDEFAKLTPPKDMQATFTAYKKDLKQFDNAVDRFLTATKARNRAQIEAVQRDATAISTRRQARIRALGLTACT